MRVAIIAVSLVLSACATPAQQALNKLDSSLDAMIGQPVEVALAQFGEPIGSVPIGPDMVYGWGHAFTSTETLHRTIDVAAGAHAQSGVYPAPRRTVQNQCVLRIVVNADGRIRDWDYQGDDNGCRYYADRLAGHPTARAG